MQRRTIDIIVPVFNEATALPQFYTALSRVVSGLPYSFRFLFVDDGSSDGTLDVITLLSQSDSRVVVINLSRNFGHQAAISAGLHFCAADALIMMDGDGEHPPELIPEMLNLFESGYDVVQTQRLDIAGSRRSTKSILGRLFYLLINHIGETDILRGGADFRLMSRNAVNALRQLPEYHKFYRGMVPWLGFRHVVLPFIPSPRLGGASKYSLRKMLRLAGDGLFSFSLSPLRFGLFLGSVFLVLALAEISFVLSFWIRGDTSSLVPGWSSLMIVLTVSSGISMLLIGILGIYVGMIFQEVKRRPVYLIRSVFGADFADNNAVSQDKSSL